MSHEYDYNEPTQPTEEPLYTSPQRRSSRGPIDLTAIGVRIAAAAVMIGIAVVIISIALRPQEQPAVVEIPTTLPTLPIQIQEEEPTPVVVATHTPLPTVTPPPTNEPTPPPPTLPPEAPGGELAIGAQVKVSGTSGEGVNMREGNGLTFNVVQLVAEDTQLEIIDGPSPADGYVWWKVRLTDAREGWVVEDFISP